MNKVLLSIILVLILINCNSNYEIPTITINIEPSSIELEFLELGAGALLYRNERYYIISSNNKAIIIADQFLNTLKVYDKPGLGPGEFARINAITSNDSNVFVHDNLKYSIEIFDLSFNYIESITLANRIVSITSPRNKTIYATILETDSWELVEISGEGYERTKVHYLESTNNLTEGFSRINDFDNLLLISRPMTNKYSIFEMNTGKISHFTNNHLPSEPVFRTMGNVKLPEKPVWRNGWIHENHVYQFYIGDDEKRYIYANDMSGKTIKRFLLEGDEGFIYYRGSSLISISADKLVEYPITHFEIQ